ncbi:MAG: glycosyltransferase family 4 protein [Deltaproteobacteria bacterium]|nr:glycosyltransferase family 4 protein [Deltaproteobacteria bacterium]
MANSVLYPVCMILGGAGAWIMGTSALKLGLVDRPNDRSSHAAPTPKGGGVGILTAFVVSSLALKIPASFLLSGTILALASLYGDRFAISPKFRLPVQFIAALVLLSPVLFSDSFASYDLPTTDHFPLTTAFSLLPLSVFVMGTANFYNFMDGINGIAGITGIVAFGLLALSASLSGTDSSFVTLAICISLSCLGFLPFNMPKAKVFMGDVSSILLGFVFAGMVVWLAKSLLDFICLSAFLFPFYADELTTMYVRLRDGENLTRPHRRHLYQLLANEKGISHWKISVGYGLLQLVVGLSILLLRHFGSVMILFLLATYFGGFVGVSYCFRRRLGD